MKRVCVSAAVLAALVVGFVFVGRVVAQQGEPPDSSQARVRIGYAINPVPLNLQGRNRDLVGMGSYLVNAVGGCNDCHTWPSYAPGGDPFLGQPEMINAAIYLAGGRIFGPFVSRNLTPDPVNGMPAGLTFEEFLEVMRTGKDEDQVPPYVPGPGPDNDLLQVMPWPVIGNMSDRDLRAIYEYLSAIPSLPDTPPSP